MQSVQHFDTGIQGVIKKDGQTASFDKSKIREAVMAAMRSISNDNADADAADDIASRVMRKLDEWGTSHPKVDQIHVLVENSLMDAGYYDTARSYVIYRHQQKEKHKLFVPREAEEPVEYPKALSYADAINDTYWTHNKWADLFDADIQDFKVDFNDAERIAAERAMLAISQIENKVKSYWSNVRHAVQKPEVIDMADTFAESEVRHKRAYKELLRRLGLIESFEQLHNVPAIEKRVRYLNKVNANIHATNDPRQFYEATILFSMLVENVSLFSQFFVLMSFNKHKNQLSGMSNVVDATSKEELIHADAGFWLANTMSEEQPAWLDEALQDQIRTICHEAYEAECEIVDWMMPNGDLDHLKKSTVKEYIKFRINQSMDAIGIGSLYVIDKAEMEQFLWMEQHNDLSKNIDFFSKRSNEYNQDKSTFQTAQLGKRRRQRRNQRTQNSA